MNRTTQPALPSSLAPPHRRRGLVAALAVLLLPLVVSAQVFEYRVKAAFVFNFAKFVDWPAESFPTPETHLRVAIWAPDEPYRVMAAALTDKTVRHRRVVVERFNPDNPPPHILFVHEQSEPIPSEMMRHLLDEHVLVIGESKGFAQRYGVIGLVPDGDSLRFQVNIAAAEHAQLQLSGQLARLAEVVKGN